ncbi:MAG: endonuclease/exonuclease/phosphatase family protein [Planctomycetota bacterium]
MFASSKTPSYPQFNAAVAQVVRKPALMAPWIMWLSWGHFAFMWGLIALIHGVSEHWWLGTMMVYLPRIPWLVPSLILIPLSIRWGWKPAVINLAAGLLALGPVMNWQSGGLFRPDIDRQAYRLTVVSCNVQSFRPDFAQVVNELHQIDPDVVLFQEAFEDHALLATVFEGWNVHRVDEYLVASKFPLKFISQAFVQGYDRVTAVRYEVETPMGPVAVFNVHQTSPRRSLTQLKPWSMFIGSGIETVEQGVALRDVEAMKTRAFTQPEGLDQPVIVAGDFNMPNDSSLFRKHWGNLSDAYASTAVGYGYTSPCRASKLWPANTPWAQVDHILANRDWQVERCWIGKSAGSDHRLIAAQLRLPMRKKLDP